MTKKPENWSKACPSANLSIAHPTLNALVLKPGLGCKKPLTNRLSYSTAKAKNKNATGIKTTN